jgi:hypothetical protein
MISADNFRDGGGTQCRHKADVSGRNNTKSIVRTNITAQILTMGSGHGLELGPLSQPLPHPQISLLGF